MTAEEARERFAGARVAVLATVGDYGRPHLVPVVFALRGDEIVTAVDHKPKRTASPRRLRNIAARPQVCLLVDAYDEDWDRLWWVRADGDARILRPETSCAASRDASRQAACEERRCAVAALRHKYAPYRHQPLDGALITIAVRRWRGWRAVDCDGTAPEP